MSDVEKITSDIIQTTSDIFLSVCNALKSKSLQSAKINLQLFINQEIGF